MKKTILTGVILLFSTIAHYAFSMNTDPLPAAIKPAQPRTLVINANVTVVLVNGDDAFLRMEGGKDFEEQLTIRQTGHKLVIEAKRSRNLKGKGVIYVPAAYLKYIEINGDSYVKALTTLQNPKLDVLINGECKLHVVTTGVVNLLETERYSFEYKTRPVFIPVMVNGK
ncbi:MAG TPA: DUF2807 domain-containing protein [Chitinophagaceae bacterium]